MDDLVLDFSEITLHRSSITQTDNTPADTCIIEPISFKMELARNMNGAQHASDPPDIKV